MSDDTDRVREGLKKASVEDVHDDEALYASPAPQRRSGVRTNDELIDEVHGMFPTLKRDTVYDILRCKHADLEAALPLLLEVNGPETARIPPEYMQGGEAYEPRRRRPFEPKWDPSQLHYSPRVRPPRTTPHPSTRMPPPEPSMWPGPEEAQKFSEDLDRMAERGFAKLGSTFSNLRQKAQQAIRNREGASKLFQSQSAYDGYVPRSGAGWSPMSYMRKSPYDNDPQVLSDAELETLVHEPTVPSKNLPDPAPQVPKRPSASEMERFDKSMAKESVPLPDEKGTHAKADRDQREPRTSEADSDNVAAQAHSTANGQSTDKASENVKSKHAEKSKAADTEDEEYIDNPFDDDD